MAGQKVGFLYLSEEDMIKAGVLDMKGCVETVGEVVALLSEGDYLMGGKDHNDHGIQLIFPKESKIEGFPLYDSRDRRFMAMPAYLGGKYKMVGEKWYGSNGRNESNGLPRSILMVTLNDLETGQPIAYMSANILSAMRTGAMPGMAAKYLARKDSKVLSLIGAGTMNNFCLRAIMEVMEHIDTIKIKGGSPASASANRLKEFALNEYPQLKEVTVCATLEEAVRDADIISEAVSVPGRAWPYVESEWLKPGCTVISSGTMDIDEGFMKDHMTKVVENLGMYEEYINVYQEYGADGKRLSHGVPGMNFVHMIREGSIEEKDVKILGDIVRGRTPARTSEEEMMIICVNGMPVLDVAWGYECYKKAIEKGIGTPLTLWNEPYLLNM
ncbi:MAG: tyramine oxidase subunit B [Lachnospiraceae bacterium]